MITPVKKVGDIIERGGEAALVFPLLVLCIAFFSPLLGYTIALVVSIVRTQEIRAMERKLLGYCIAFTGAVIISSRAFGDPSDDLTVHYYPVYLEMSSGNFSSFFEWGWGVEIAINIVNSSIAVFLPKLTESGYAFSLAMLSNSIFVVIVEKYLLQESNQRKKAVMAAVIYAVYSVYFSTQLSRQLFASLFLIVALFEYRRSVAYIALFAGAIFHLSTLPLYAFYKFAGWFRLSRFYLFVPIAIGSYYLIGFMEPLLKLVSAGLPDTRLLYYGEGDALETNLFPLRYLLVGLFSLLAVLYFDFKRVSEREKVWISVYFVVVTFYILTIEFKSFPTRAFLMIHGMLLGWFLVMMYRRLSFRACILISLLLVMFYVQSKLFVDKSVINALWVQFDQVSYIPGYYFLNYFK